MNITPASTEELQAVAEDSSLALTFAYLMLVNIRHGSTYDSADYIQRCDAIYLAIANAK